MCIYSGPGGVCLGDPNRKSGLTAEGKARVLDKHNELRSLVARGEQPGQPKATNMRRLVWSHELETVAQRWADQCVFGHDKVKTKLDGTYVGQNGFIEVSEAKSPVDTVMEGMGKAVKSWFDEVTNPGFSAENISPYVFTSGTGHYTQVVWADTTEVGCGWSYFRDAGYVKNLLICNYAEGGNYPGAHMYEPGPPCSNCPPGTTCDSQDLCS